MEYNVVSGVNITEFEDAVISGLEDGWELAGGVSVCVTRDVGGHDGTGERYYYDTITYSQALIRTVADKQEVSGE